MISVVIPLYNKAHTITKTIDSVLNQKFKEFEIVIINDGSTDNGVEIIRKFTSDSRIRIFDQANQGVSVARNNGVAKAKYEYIAFLDGDDEWHHDYLLKMKESIELFPDAGMYCCAGTIRNADGTEVLRLAKKYRGKIEKVDFFENPQVLLHTSATIVVKSVFKQSIGFPVGMKRNQDFALFFSIALIAPVVYCGFTLTVYVGGVQGQATSTPKEKVLEHVVKRFNLVYDNWLKSDRVNKTFVIYMKYELRHMIIELIRKNDYKSILFIIKNLTPVALSVFPDLEVVLYKQRFLRNISKLYILVTKIRWRMRGYPYVGQI